MSSRDASFDSSSDSETAEMEVEYDLEVEVMSNVSEQKDTSDDDEPEDVLIGLFLHLKTVHLSGISFLSLETKIVPNQNAINGLEWRYKLRYTQTTLSDSAARSCFEKARYFRSLKIHKKLGFQLNAKIFVAFFLIPYRDCTKWKTFFLRL